MTDAFTPTVRTIIEAIRSKVVDGTLRVGTPLPPETELALELQVGRGSVRKAIEILTETGELERERYSRPVIARSFTRTIDSSKTDIHVWVAQTVRENTSFPFLQAVSRELTGTQYRLFVQEPSFFVGSVVQADERKFYQELLKAPNAAGAIIWRDAFADHSDVVSQLIDRGIPLVFVDSAAPGDLETDHVGTANAAAAKQCIRHLLELGHRRIVCVTDTAVPFAIQGRIKGYWRAMRQAGLGVSENGSLFGKVIVPPDIEQHDPWNDPLGGVYARFLETHSFYHDIAHRLTEEILSIDPLPTALFVVYDVLARWIAALLEGRGIRVPQQISIVGFDWRAQWEKAGMDELTTAGQDFEGFGRHAANLLIDRISGECSSLPRQILLDAPLIVRSSTAPLLSSRPDFQLAINSPG